MFCNNIIKNNILVLKDNNAFQITVTCQLYILAIDPRSISMVKRS